MIAKSNRVIEETVELVPCCHCGSENLDLFNCGYSSFNVAGVDCKDCGYQFRLNGADWNMPDTDIAKAWNVDNDLDKNIASVEKHISQLQDRVRQLKKMKRKYAHKT